MGARPRFTNIVIDVAAVSASQVIALPGGYDWLMMRCKVSAITSAPTLTAVMKGVWTSDAVATTLASFTLFTPAAGNDRVWMLGFAEAGTPESVDESLWAYPLPNSPQLTMVFGGTGDITYKLEVHMGTNRG